MNSGSKHNARLKDTNVLWCVLWDEVPPKEMHSFINKLYFNEEQRSPL